MFSHAAVQNFQMMWFLFRTIHYLWFCRDTMESSKIDILAKNYRLCVLIATRQYLLGTTDTNLFIGIVSWLPGILWAMLSSDVNQVKHVWDMMRVLSRFIHVLKLDWLRGTVATRSTNVNPSCRIHKSSCSPIYQVQFSYEEPRNLLGLIYQGNECSYSQVYATLLHKLKRCTSLGSCLYCLLANLSRKYCKYGTLEIP